MTGNWRNRIIRQETVPISDIVPNAKNWRKHPAKQQTHVKGSLDNLGWIRSVLVNLRTSDEWEIPHRNKKTIIDGHLRLDLALKNGEQKIPVEYVDLTPDEERIALASIDPLAAMAETDEKMLDELLSSIDCDVPEITDMLADVGELGGLDTGKQAEEDDYEPPPEIITTIKRGDIIQLGRHRVMCGDSTSKEDVERLMGGGMADMCFTDPPYGIGYEYNGYEDIKGEKYLKFCDSFFSIIKDFTNLLVITTGWNYKPFWYAKDPYDEMIWFDKGKQSGGRAFHLRKTEPIFIFGKVREKYKWDIIECLRDNEKVSLRDVHSCPKPISFIAQLIDPQTKPNNRILDPFLGSGTTLIACEQLNRVCYGMEISPQYCEVICQRWEKLTGKTREMVVS